MASDVLVSIFGSNGRAPRHDRELERQKTQFARKRSLQVTQGSAFGYTSRVACLCYFWFCPQS